MKTFRAARAEKSGWIDPALFKALRWRHIGPFRGGRVTAVTGVPGEPGLFYFGAAAGGVWKTQDNGGHWTPIFDQVPDSSIGAIAVAPSNHQVIYVGTGEGALRNDITNGRGVYKSIDGGKSWTHIGLSDTGQIGELVVDPRNADIVLVAAIGHPFGPNSERGVFRSTDGGKSWKKVLYRDENTGAADVTYDPDNPDVVYASLWQVSMRPWGDTSSGPGSGLFRSQDGGRTWVELKGNGLPNGPLGRIGVSVSGADSRRVYALIEADWSDKLFGSPPIGEPDRGGLYRSDDGGEHWARTSDDSRIRNRPLYYGKVFADPRFADTIYIVNTAVLRSTDGGKSFAPAPFPGYDHHYLWIDPADPRRIISGCDVGASVSIDEGQTWSTYDNQPLAQFYHVAADNRFPYWVYGAQQDFGNIAIASYSSEGAIGPRSWYPAGGGEAGFVIPDPRNPMIIFSTTAEMIGRYDKQKEQWQNVSASTAPDPWGVGAELAHRFNWWSSPLMLSPHDPDVLYAASEMVWKSSDQGNNWTAISPDLTRNDKSKQQWKAIWGSYDAIVSLAESPLRKGLLWVGSDDGLINMTRDGGTHWTDVTPGGVAPWSFVSMIEPSRFNAEAAYVAIDSHRLDDWKPSGFKTADGGRTWVSIAGDLPEDAVVHAVREDPARQGLLYAATERGVFVSLDDGVHWQPLQLNLPATPIYDIMVKNDDLVVATHGRGFWILDNVTPLRQITAGAGAREAMLLTPKTAYMIGTQTFGGSTDAVGKNPPPGAAIDYVLTKRPQGEVTLDILDVHGALIRRLSSIEASKEQQAPQYVTDTVRSDKIPTEVGMNRVYWDFRTSDPEQVPGAYYYGGFARGVLVTPGRYMVRLNVDGRTYERPLTLAIDPRAAGREGANAERVALQSAVLKDIDRLHKAMNELRKRRPRTADQAHVGKMSVSASKLAQLAGEMDSIDAALVKVKTNSFATAYCFPHELEVYTSPRQQERALVDGLHQRVETALATWSSLRAELIK
ncbi:hypothetical protein [Mesorhizobium sp. M0208]|uniref:WD40/YVTN/BNR-like repeat-containing protein n=1 Tax=Mesorhizobium sp. M0208 TaxID=2956916 RepID=UPI0033353349